MSEQPEITITAKPSYEEACGRLEAIIRRLVEVCAAELDAVGQGLEELKLDELVARLEARPAAE